jgi:putative FmdB family regulatory protein
MRLVMPIYEYVCKNCSHHFEVLQKMSDEPVQVCPKCQATAVERMVSAAGFQLKGTGWYATDFKNPPKSKESSTDKTTSAPASVEAATTTPSTQNTNASESKKAK